MWLVSIARLNEKARAERREKNQSIIRMINCYGRSERPVTWQKKERSVSKHFFLLCRRKKHNFANATVSMVHRHRLQHTELSSSIFSQTMKSESRNLFYWKIFSIHIMSTQSFEWVFSPLAVFFIYFDAGQLRLDGIGLFGECGNQEESERVIFDDQQIKLRLDYPICRIWLFSWLWSCCHRPAENQASQQLNPRRKKLLIRSTLDWWIPGIMCEHTPCRLSFS